MNKKSGINPLVTIRCITYNHEPYIRQCLEGFVMQKTSFCFEAIVHDDASTDGTVNIIREYAEKYPEIIKPIYETENQYSKGDGSLTRIMDAHTHGKYVATCEGDDYWTDPYKLQKQVDILEQNPKASFCYTAYKVVNDKGQEILDETYRKYMKRSKSGCHFLDLLINSNKIMSMTFMTTHSVHIARPEYYYDYGLFLLASRTGEGIYLPDVTASYRVNPNSIIRSAKHTLYPLRLKIILNEIKTVYQDDSFNQKDLMKHPLLYTCLGFALISNIVHNSYNRMDYIIFLLSSPSLYYYVIKGITLKLFYSRRFREKIASLT